MRSVSLLGGWIGGEDYGERGHVAVALAGPAGRCRRGREEHRRGGIPHTGKTASARWKNYIHTLESPTCNPSRRKRLGESPDV